MLAACSAGWRSDSRSRHSRTDRGASPGRSSRVCWARCAARSRRSWPSRTRAAAGYSGPRCARSVIRRFQPHVVVSSGPPHSAHLVAGMATAGIATRWLIDLRDPWGGPLEQAWASHARIGTGVFRTLSPLLERLAFRASDGVITNAQQLATVLTERYPDVPVVCVPNGVDPEGLPGRAPRPYVGLGVAYTGTLYAGRDLGPVVQALRLFLARRPEAARAGSKLRIAGRAEVPHARAFRAAVAAAGMAPHVEVLGALSRPEAMNVLSRSHLAVVLAQEQRSEEH